MISKIKFGVKVKRVKIFKIGKYQAVRLPKEFGIKGDEVYITKVDDKILLFPKKPKWDYFIESLDNFGDDILPERKQPKL